MQVELWPPWYTVRQLGFVGAYIVASNLWVNMEGMVDIVTWLKTPRYHHNT